MRCSSPILARIQSPRPDSSARARKALHLSVCRFCYSTTVTIDNHFTFDRKGTVSENRGRLIRRRNRLYVSRHYPYSVGKEQIVVTMAAQAEA